MIKYVTSFSEPIYFIVRVNGFHFEKVIASNGLTANPNWINGLFFFLYI